MNTKPKKFIFVAMPFSDENDNVYKLIIKEACKSAGVVCQRLDEQIYTTGMLEQIYTQINKSDFLIADMSGRNPNVFYEVGYAHALGKRVILITNNAGDIPFDLKHYQHIIYEKNKLAHLKDKLIEYVIYFKEEEIDKKIDFHDYTYSINATYISENKELLVKPNINNDDTIEFNIDIHNPTIYLIQPANNKLCLLLPKQYLNLAYGTYPLIDDNYVEFDIGTLPKLFPYGHGAVQVTLEKNKRVNNEFYFKNFTRVTLRIYTSSGISDINFMIRFEPDFIDYDSD